MLGLRFAPPQAENPEALRPPVRFNRWRNPKRSTGLNPGTTRAFSPKIPRAKALVGFSRYAIEMSRWQGGPSRIGGTSGARDGQSAAGIGTRPNRRRRSGKVFLKANCNFFLATSAISCSFKRAFIQEFKIPGGQFRHQWRHQFGCSTPHKGAPNGSLWSEDLVITGVSDEILNSRTRPNSL
jgi:hypothetical protein